MFWWVLMKSWTKLGRDPSMQARSLAKISWACGKVVVVYQDTWEPMDWHNRGCYFTFQASSRIPLEQCTLEPKQECRDVSVLVPSLVPVEKCLNVPRETCSKVLVPRKIKRISTRLYCDGDKLGIKSGLARFWDPRKPQSHCFFSLRA